MTTRKTASKPATIDLPTVAALKALAEGKANATQQIRAMDWVINKVSRPDLDPYHADALETAYACGQQSVGKQIRGAMLMSPENMEKLKNARRK